MNGLDLTSWIEKASTVEMIQTVCVVAALISGGLCFFVFVTSFCSEPSKLNRIFFAFSLAVFCLSLICGTPTGIYYRTELSEIQFNRYVADGYGLAELDCTLPDDYLEGMDDFTTCTAISKDADMTVKTKVTHNLNFIIRDDRAYLYDENGDLMEVKQ